MLTHSNKNFFCACALLMLSACSSNWSLSLPTTNGNYVPDVNLKGEERRKYEEDVALCQKQILKQYGDKYISNNAIIDVRQCLIQKGYVLLS
jgi:hypothetical protein